MHKVAKKRTKINQLLEQAGWYLLDTESRHRPMKLPASPAGRMDCSFSGTSWPYCCEFNFLRLKYETKKKEGHIYPEEI